MTINYRGAGLLIAKFNSQGDFQVCLGKRNIHPCKGVYSLQGGGAHYSKSISLIGNLRWKKYSEDFATTALREAKEEVQIIGQEFPDISTLVPLQSFPFGFYNWKNFGVLLKNPQAEVKKRDHEFVSLDWYSLDQLPKPLFRGLGFCIRRFERLCRENI